MVTLCIPRKDIRFIYNKVKGDREWGGYYIYNKSKIVRKTFKGEEMSVNVPIQDFYNIHWHTHPYDLIEHNITSPIQMPSVEDIAMTSYKYFMDIPLGRTNLIHVVFTTNGIYVQKPIPEILDNFFKTPRYTIKTEKKSDIKTDKGLAIWENKWYNRFEREASHFGVDIAGVFWDAKYNNKTQTTQETFKKAFEIEKQFFQKCEEFGVKVTKLTNWNTLLKKGLCVEY
jgi:hypothetical protein